MNPKTQKLIILLISVSVLFLSVAYSANEGSGPVSKVYDYDYNKVWNALVSAVASGNYEIATLEKDSGILVTKSRVLATGWEANKAMDRVSYLPSIPMSIWTQGNGELSFKVTSIESNKTEVQVSAKYKTYEDNVTKSWYDCPSNGKNEATLLEELGKRIPLQKEISNSTATMQSNDTLSKLERLADLKKQGVLTDDEFIEQKKKLLLSKI